ncbi:uncharacterized protein BJ212DRAFT_1327525 [Suillus subaureus]|uniref:Fibronectin type-III domain-containing protein n=1 Tax=Suillus subaureus TaxID=48587 RepID=A0A9P7EL69_9AGAM|nr:uncharacterized protein BJ212DRAFT_1327525 [Suillus subaureus]KAG1823977.1 hypothetical protein BJ212DRAFT_1327525 [Suillus subaureus]
MTRAQDSFTFTVGKLDAGMAILLGDRAHLIEFPSVLLPPGATTGSIVNIAVHQNVAQERKRDHEFWSLQEDILETFGSHSPENPQLEVRNVTQTSVTLEWPPIKLATAKLRSLDIYKNGQRLASIPNALSNYSTKLSGLSVDTQYTFQLLLRTSAGTYPSNLIRVRTHTIADTSGISVCFANVTDSVLLENAKLALKEMRAKWSDKIQIDTTHFVCTTPAVTPSGAQATGGVSAAPGAEYQRALQLSIPVVQPQWILACHSEKKMVPISGYYLGVTPPVNSSYSQRPQSMSQASLPSSSATHKSSASRQSLPAIRRSTPPSATPQRQIDEEEDEEEQPPKPPLSDLKHKSSGTMDRNFKFPTSQTQAQAVPPVPSLPTQAPAPKPEPEAGSNRTNEDDMTPVAVVVPSSVEVPPPPPVEKEIRKSFVESDDGEEEVGETVEIDLR